MGRSSVEEEAPRPPDTCCSPTTGLAPSPKSAFRPVKHLQCAYCGIPFLNSGELVGHLRVHTAGPLRAPGTSDKALGLDAPKEEPFKRSLSFGIGGSSGDDKNTYQLMFLFGKGKKGRSQEPGRKLMSDAMLTKTEHDEETIAAVLRAPGRQLIT
ncbi:hypothetical protein MRX96_006709 [Rhipicephalus microplus]